MGRRNKGQYKLDHAVSKKQKQILSAFGMNEKSIDKAAVEIGKLLANNQSLLDTENETKEEDDYDGEDAFYDFDWHRVKQDPGRAGKTSGKRRIPQSKTARTTATEAGTGDQTDHGSIPEKR
ncbi:MAG: hypothetical protein LUB59_02075 [Candidatus Gastranaerophilales bacterium]|nr:hypothetical protein [Candidatus Gastranaerophilales bacterium]